MMTKQHFRKLLTGVIERPGLAQADPANNWQCPPLSHEHQWEPAILLSQDYVDKCSELLSLEKVSGPALKVNSNSINFYSENSCCRTPITFGQNRRVRLKELRRSERG